MHTQLTTQPFSTSRIVNLNIIVGDEIPDVERNGHCFTDGCAIAGEEVLKQAALALNAKGLNA
ncbi:UNVERIFIED_CONTAM: RNA-dependent RNA polymerase, partial [Bacteroidetes bacterium 56_B9]